MDGVQEDAPAEGSVDRIVLEVVAPGPPVGEIGAELGAHRQHFADPLLVEQALGASKAREEAEIAPHHQPSLPAPSLDEEALHAIDRMGDGLFDEQVRAGTEDLVRERHVRGGRRADERRLRPRVQPVLEARHRPDPLPLLDRAQALGV